MTVDSIKDFISFRLYTAENKLDADRFECRCMEYSNTDMQAILEFIKRGEDKDQDKDYFGEERIEKFRNMGAADIAKTYVYHIDNWFYAPDGHRYYTRESAENATVRWLHERVAN